MQTIDFHTHLLSPGATFQRPFDRLMLLLFGRQMGFVQKQGLSLYESYLERFIDTLRNSSYVKKVCLFPVDARLDNKGNQIHKDTSVCSTTEDVLALYQKYPDLIIPFLSINPLRVDALDRIDLYTEQGCKGAKFLQNYWQIDTNDKRFIPYYEKLKAKGIPLVVHTGSEFAIGAKRAFEGTQMLRLPLEIGVTIVASHMALGQIDHKIAFWRNLSKNPKNFDQDYHALCEMLLCRENLYADLAGILSPLRARALRHLAQQKEIHGKLLFATDYPVPFATILNTFDLSCSVRLRLAKTTNFFDRYAQILLEYFPDGSPIYTNYKKILD